MKNAVLLPVVTISFTELTFHHLGREWEGGDNILEDW